MKNKKNYIYLAIFIILIVIVLGSKALLNNNISGNSSETVLVEQDSQSDEIKVTFVELGSVGCIPCDKM